MKCQYCGKDLSGSAKKFCDNSCKNKHHWKLVYEEIERSGKFPNRGMCNETERRIARRYLEERNGHKCSICGIREWNGKPIILVVDHIDGDSSNSLVTNVRLICPNCDSQLLTYKNRMGKSRINNSGDLYDRAKRKSEEYDNKLKKLGLTRCTRTRAKGICPICGIEFDKRNLSQKYCTKKCLFEANRRNPSGFCVH